MTLAFRLPLSEDLRNLLLQTGPLVAPSANPEGLAPAKNITEAQNYFGPPAQAGNSVDLYIDGGEIVGKASKIIRLNDDGSVVVIRE
jgi:L-threonylcarbamoyladenylate synthase